MVKISIWLRLRLICYLSRFSGGDKPLGEIHCTGVMNYGSMCSSSSNQYIHIFDTRCPKTQSEITSQRMELCQTMFRMRMLQPSLSKEKCNTCLFFVYPLYRGYRNGMIPWPRSLETPASRMKHNIQCGQDQNYLPVLSLSRN